MTLDVNFHTENYEEIIFSLRTQIRVLIKNKSFFGKVNPMICRQIEVGAEQDSRKMEMVRWRIAKYSM